MKSFYSMAVPSIIGTLMMLGGCAASSPDTGRTASAPFRHEECLVCKFNADLACIDVEVDKNTPMYEYKDKTYCFCSDICRKKFAQNPTKYLSH